jgi:hypothetical protein
LGNLAYTSRSDAIAAIAYYRRSIEAVPGFGPAHSAISFVDTNILSHPEEGLAEGQKIDAKVRTDPQMVD